MKHVNYRGETQDFPDGVVVLRDDCYETYSCDRLSEDTILDSAGPFSSVADAAFEYALTRNPPEFQEWLAEHDREVAAKALREAADAMDADPGFRDPLRLHSDWLRTLSGKSEAKQ